MTPNTKVHLLTGVPFNNSYTNVRSFSNLTEQNNYFLSKVVKTMDNATYQRVNNSSVKVGFKYEDVENINYMMFLNNEKWYYAFVVSVDYVNEQTTLITYELDVYQTFMFDFEFKTSFVEREHVKRFNADGTPIYYLENEELNYGDAYDVVDVKKYNNITALDTPAFDYDIGFLIIATPMDLTLSGFNTYGGSSFNDINTNLYYYLVPFNKSDVILPIGVNDKYISSLYYVLQALSSVADLVGKTCSIYYTNYLPLEVKAETKSGPFGPDGVVQQYINLTIGNLSAVTISASAPYNVNLVPLGDLENIETQEINCGDKYDGFTNFSESKLFQYPYTLIEMTDLKGHSFVLKPEYINGKNLTIGFQSMISSSPKIAFIPKNYNTDGYLIENGFIDTDTNDIPVINDATASYIQSNRNVLNLQDTYALDNANRSTLQTNSNLRITNAQINTNENMGYISSGVNALSGIVSMASGNIGGGLSQVINSGMSAYQNYYDSMYAKERANQNANFSNINARTSAEQEIGLRQAKLADINNQPPTISGQGKDIVFSGGYDYGYLYIIKKQIKQEFIEKISMYFKMFGYKVNKVEIPNLASRTNWNYIKTIACNIIGNIPLRYLLILKSIFDKGVTIWHTDNMYDYSLENEEVN